MMKNFYIYGEEMINITQFAFDDHRTEEKWILVGEKPQKLDSVRQALNGIQIFPTRQFK